MSSKGGWLESIHLYRKVPRDLTDATRLGGLLSLMCGVVMFYLFVSNIAEYMSMTTTSDVALDDTGDVHMRLFFNITMERLPCQFATVDLADAMGTSLTNVTAEIIKFRVATESGAKEEFYVEQPRAVKHEDLGEEELQLYKTMPENVPMLTDADFDRFVQTNSLVMIAFGAPWCPWSQRLEPVWRKTYEELKKKPWAESVRARLAPAPEPWA